MPENLLLLVEKCGHCLSYYRPDSGERLATIGLPEYPHEFVVDRANRYAYVAHYGVEGSGIVGAGGHSVIQIDVARRAIARTIDVWPYNRLHGIQIDDHDRLFVASEQQAVLLTFDQPASDAAPSRAAPTGGIKSHLFALTGNGEYAFVMNLLSHTVTKIKPGDATFTPLACRPGTKPEGYRLSADEQRLYVTSRISNTLSVVDTATMEIQAAVATRVDANRIYRYRDGRLLLTNYGDRSVSIVDPMTLAERDCVATEARAVGVTFDPRRAIAYVSLDDNRIGRLNMDTLRFDGFFETFDEPDVAAVVAA